MKEREEITPGDREFARLLYRSGYGSRPIAARLSLDGRLVENLVRREGWRHATPLRYGAVLGLRVPVLARCSECMARFGEEWGKPRACPRCGSTLRGAPAQLELYGCEVSA